MFQHFVQVLDEAGAPYCILAGYDGYPEVIGSDVDFMVAPAWNGRLPHLIAEAAARSGAHLVQYLRHETTASYFVIARLNGSSVCYLHPDSSTDYRQGGRRWMEAARVLERRRRHARGFWIPAADDAFMYYLIKKIDKGGRLDESHGSQLTRRYLEDPKGASRVLRALLPEPEAERVETASKAGSWSDIPSLGHLRPLLQAQAPDETWDLRVRQAGADLRRVASRLAAPTGLHIVFLGPDGSGKSTVISAVCREMGRAFRLVHQQHLRPRLLMRGRHAGTVTEPHAKPPRGPAASTIKLLVFWLDYVLGAALWFFPRKVRSTLLVFDRYFHDIIADPKRYRYGGSLWLARLLGRTVPQPDLLFILDAPASILQQRKQEVPEAEGERQRKAYLRLKSEFREVRVIDVSQPLEKVVADVLGHIIAFQEARTLRRLKTGASVASTVLADPAS